MNQTMVQASSDLDSRWSVYVEIKEGWNQGYQTFLLNTPLISVCVLSQHGYHFSILYFIQVNINRIFNQMTQTMIQASLDLDSRWSVYVEIKEGFNQGYKTFLLNFMCPFDFAIQHLKTLTLICTIQKIQKDRGLQSIWQIDSLLNNIQQTKQISPKNRIEK